MIGKTLTYYHTKPCVSHIQSFQFLVIHRIINCNDNLFKWKILDNPTCFYCTSVDTIEHHFFIVKSLEFWKDLSFAIVTALNFEISFTVCEILLGLHLQTNPKIKCINYLILMGKWFLNNKKSTKCPIFFKEYLHLIKTKLEVLYLVHQKERNIENFNEVYLDFLNFLQKL